MKWQDWGFVGALVVFLFIFPLSNGYIAWGVSTGLVWLANALDAGITQLAVIGAGFVASPVTVMIGYVVWRLYNSRERVNIPSKSAKTKKAGEFREV